jgi:predicted RNA methylase
MSKKSNDKYYTPVKIAKRCIEKTIELIGEENITEIIEPSAGNGSFSSQIDNCIAYDIEPEAENIICADFLTTKIDYKKGRVIIGNPPFGAKMYLAQQFFKKAVEIADYIAFILPISQLHNSNSLYEFDLIFSADLGMRTYTDRKLHCCFNVYKRPENEQLNKKPKTKLTDITIIRQDSEKYHNITQYDLRMCYWGDATAGKILNTDEHYSAEYKIIINNPDLADKIINCFHTINWKKELNCIAMLKIQQFHIITLLKKYIPEIQ